MTPAELEQAIIEIQDQSVVAYEALKKATAEVVRLVMALSTVRYHYERILKSESTYVVDHPELMADLWGRPYPATIEDILFQEGYMPKRPEKEG